MMRCRRPLNPTSVVVVAACSLLVAACGSTSPSSSSSAGDPTNAQMQQDVVNFADCMRSHGVPNFPDPTTRAFKFALAPSTAHSPAFLSAYAVCRHLLPNNGGQDAAHNPAQIAALLAFARCIRSHGFPNFPDPTAPHTLLPVAQPADGNV